MRKVFAVTLCVAIALLGMPGSLVAASKTATAQPPQTGTAKIEAKDCKRKPLAGATVNVTNAAGEVVGTATTNAAGEAVLTLPLGTFNVSIVSGGVAVGSASITVAAGALTTTIVTTTGCVPPGGGALFGLGMALLVGGSVAGLGIAIYHVTKNDASPSR